MNRLHPEVIALCAAFVYDADPKLIVSLTHVCQYWRRAITSSPRVWASIRSGWKRLAPLCLERSATVPLSVKISIPDIKWDKEFIRVLLPHTSRISDLSLTGHQSVERVAGDLPDFFTSPIPSLTSLELQQTNQPAEVFPSNTSPTPPLFQSISKLRSLHLVRTPLYPAVLSITSLVELKLVDYTTPFHFGKLIEFLSSNPNLELILLHLRFAGGSMTTPPERKAPLPQLRRLTFTCDSATDARVLLSWVSLRRGSHVTIQGLRSNSRIDLASFLPSPPTSIQEFLNPITAIKCYPKWLHIFGGDGQLSFQGSGTTKFDFTLFDTGAVREFHANLDSDGESLAPQLRRLPALEALALSGTHLPPGLLSPLTEEPILCPSLKTVAFLDCKVTGKGIIKELEEVLAKRNVSTAARLYRVVIVNHTRALPDLQSILRLRNIVPHVDVGAGDELPDLL